MSEENMEAARQTLEAFDRRDRAAWLATRDDQDYEVVTDRYWPEADSIRGREAAWEFYVKVAEAFEQLPAGDAELVDAGADKVLVRSKLNTMQSPRPGCRAGDSEARYQATRCLRRGALRG